MTDDQAAAGRPQARCGGPEASGRSGGRRLTWFNESEVAIRNRSGDIMMMSMTLSGVHSPNGRQRENALFSGGNLF